ncbi:hypothetical protein [Rickettsia tamurae]|nr:hypothetical protein [Rickettsia tamurae]EER22568.1 hypothetical protein REIS_1802 [Rickettsia endosymbiont of Ixodes scapularis]
MQHKIIKKYNILIEHSFLNNSFVFCSITNKCYDEVILIILLQNV